MEVLPEKIVTYDTKIMKKILLLYFLIPSIYYYIL